MSENPDKRQRGPGWLSAWILKPTDASTQVETINVGTQVAETTDASTQWEDPKGILRYTLTPFARKILDSYMTEEEKREWERCRNSRCYWSEY